jgi:hypothetical protein
MNKARKKTNWMLLAVLCVATLSQFTFTSCKDKDELSEEEKAFLSQPHLHIATSEEFERYKRQLDEYYREANAFLDDTANFQRYPSHISYLRHYQEIIQRTRKQIEADEWFRPLYKSPMNPISSYTRKYKEDLEHRAFVNGNKLP